MNYNKYIPLIVEKLKTINPYKIILFGSYAYGNPSKHSDIDLIVVLDKKSTPKNFKENMDNKRIVSDILWDINTKVPMDILVYTKPMYKKFNELGSMFSKQIALNGKVLYEKNN